MLKILGKKRSAFAITAISVLLGSTVYGMDSAHSNILPLNKDKGGEFIRKFKDPQFIYEYTKVIYPTISATKVVSDKGKNPELIDEAIKNAGDTPPDDIFKFGKLKDPTDPEGKKEIGYKYIANVVVNKQNNDLISEDNDRVEKIQSAFDKTVVYKNAGQSDSSQGPNKVSILPTVVNDIISQASELHQEGKKVGVVIAADKHNLGGGHTDGAAAMEESIMYSMPYLTAVLAAVVMADGGENGKYSIPEEGAIVVDGAKVMRLSSFKKYELVPEGKQFTLTAIFSDAPDMRFLTEEVKKEKEAEIKESEGYKSQPDEKKMGYFYSIVNKLAQEKLEKYKKAHPEYLEKLEQKIRTQFQAADDAGCEIVLYPAWGLGVFNNKTSDIIEGIKKVAADFNGKNLKEVQFVILKMDEGKFFKEIEAILQTAKL